LRAESVNNKGYDLSLPTNIIQHTQIHIYTPKQSDTNIHYTHTFTPTHTTPTHSDTHKHTTHTHIPTSCTFSRQGWQNVWKHVSTLGMVNVSWHSEQRVLSPAVSDSISESEELEVVVWVSLWDGVGEAAMMISSTLQLNWTCKHTIR
jgi:hypothetical protein